MLCMRGMTWLGMGCSDGKARGKRRDPSGVCEPAGSQSPRSTDVFRSKRIAKRPGNINRSEGRRGRKVET